MSNKFAPPEMGLESSTFSSTSTRMNGPIFTAEDKRTQNKDTEGETSQINGGGAAV